MPSDTKNSYAPSFASYAPNSSYACIIPSDEFAGRTRTLESFAQATNLLDEGDDNFHNLFAIDDMNRAITSLEQELERLKNRRNRMFERLMMNPASRRLRKRLIDMRRWDRIRKEEESDTPPVAPMTTHMTINIPSAPTSLKRKRSHSASSLPEEKKQYHRRMKRAERFPERYDPIPSAKGSHDNPINVDDDLELSNLSARCDYCWGFEHTTAYCPFKPIGTDIRDF